MTRKEELEAKKEALIREWTSLSNRYDRGFERASRFSELSQDAYFTSEGPNRILERMRQIDDEFDAVNRELRSLS